MNNDEYVLHIQWREENMVKLFDLQFSFLRNSSYKIKEKNFYGCYRFTPT